MVATGLLFPSLAALADGIGTGRPYLQTGQGYPKTEKRLKIFCLRLLSLSGRAGLLRQPITVHFSSTSSPK